jgi:O-antigen/teichoic acid export membrane protein
MPRSGQSAIIRRSRSSPVALVLIAVWVVPFALNGRTKGLILAAVVWAVVALLLARWWRRRHDPRPPDHAV